MVQYDTCSPKFTGMSRVPNSRNSQSDAVKKTTALPFHEVFFHNKALNINGAQTVF
jgi:hypothetical protein